MKMKNIFTFDGFINKKITENHNVNADTYVKMIKKNIDKDAYFALLDNNFQRTRELLDQGADPYSKHASNRDIYDIGIDTLGGLKIILDYNIKLKTRVIYKLSFGKPNMLKYFLKNCKDYKNYINYIDSYAGETVLHYLSTNQFTLSKIKLLIDYGIDTSIKNNNGETFLDLLKKNNPKKAKQIVQYMKDTDKWHSYIKNQTKNKFNL